MIDGHSVVLRTEFLFDLRHPLPRQRLEIALLRTVSGRDDEAASMAVANTAVARSAGQWRTATTIPSRLCASRDRLSLAEKAGTAPAIPPAEHHPG
jgi:hypothetical protein